MSRQRKRRGGFYYSLSLRVAREDLRRLDELKRVLPALSVNSLARTAMRIGFAVVVAEPQIAFALGGGAVAEKCRGRKFKGGS